MKLESNKFIVEIKNKGKSYFEAKNGNLGGMLKFENNELIDYDGVYELPKEVIDLLELNNFDCAKQYSQYHEVYIKLFWMLKEAKHKYLNKFIEHIYMLQGEMICNGTNQLKNRYWEKLVIELSKEIFDNQ